MATSKKTAPATGLPDEANAPTDTPVRVLEPLRLDGRDLAPGDELALDAATAPALLAAGLVARLDAAQG